MNLDTSEIGQSFSTRVDLAARKIAVVVVVSEKSGDAAAVSSKSR